jgi:hypothetical protein
LPSAVVDDEADLRAAAAALDALSTPERPPQPGEGCQPDGSRTGPGKAASQGKMSLPLSAVVAGQAVARHLGAKLSLTFLRALSAMIRLSGIDPKPVLPHQVVKGGSADAEKFGGLRHVRSGLRERLPQDLRFGAKARLTQIE